MLSNTTEDQENMEGFKLRLTKSMENNYFSYGSRMAIVQEPIKPGRD